MFIGRAEELKTIKERLDSSRFELGVIYGQRRIGKTSIILEAIKGYQYIYLLSRDDATRITLGTFLPNTKDLPLCLLPHPFIPSTSYSIP